MRRAVVAAAGVALIWVPTAVADLADEEALARKHAPVVRLVEQLEECGPGEPYEPIDVDLLFGDNTVAFRGPWNAGDLIEVGPEATDLVDRYEYHLDFPGNPLEAGCSYEEWARRLTDGATPTVYAHVATEPARPGRVALQYWFFYPFNDFNNTHEGDWEMIQLNFDAADAADALDKAPTDVGYSSHEGAEGSPWDDEDRLEVVGAHPVVYPAAGSHANKFGTALYLGSSAEQGVGCDDTRGPHREVLPAVVTIPSDPTEAARRYPWITFEGRWGELQPAFFNGPTGPNDKTQWTEPFTWADGWRDRSYAIPTGGLVGTGATDFFCSAVETGSQWLIRALRNPAPVLIGLGLLITLLVVAAVRATWLPTAPMRVARRRAWGQILAASGRLYVKRLRLFLAIGAILVPIGLVMTLLQRGVVWLTVTAGIGTSGEAGGVLLLVVIAIGTTLALFGFALVQATVACAMVELDAGRDVHAAAAYRIALRRIRPLIAATAIFVAVWVALTSTAFLIPLAVWLAVRWALVAQVVELEGLRPLPAIRRSAALVRRRWLRVGSLVGIGAGLTLIAGPLLGAVLILLTSTPLVVLNIVAGLVYAFALPFVAIVTTYVYFDARARTELAEPQPAELPSEIGFEPA